VTQGRYCRPVVAGEVEFLWRKQVMPFGVVPWRGKELNFTPAYLNDIAAAFADGAFDLVPFMAENPEWGTSIDPALYRGPVCGLEVVGDGMDALVLVGAETDAWLDADKKRGAAARLIENYRTPGRTFPVAMASLHATRSPGITMLRPWKREP
jgi:hypothetical protein